MARDQSGLVVLTTTECLKRLREHPTRVGRVAVIDGEQPLVLPVNYEVDHGTVVFRTAIGTKLGAIAAGAPVGFEVDDLEPDWGQGWSVVIRGHAEEVTTPAEISRLQRLSIRPWAPADLPRFVRIQPVEITGRLID